MVFVLALLNRAKTLTGEDTMFVGVIHRILDPALWDKKIAEFEATELPQHLRNPISYIGVDRDYAFCLWDVPSVEALQPTLDALTTGAAANTYFAVNPQATGTVGIPTQRISLDEKAPTVTG